MIAENLLKLRNKLSLTQNEFALKLGITVRSYINYERGERKLPYELLVKLADEFDVNLNWFIAAKGEMFLSDNNFAAEFENAKKDVLKEVKKMFEERGL